jgi:hypothetical protein
VSISGRGIKAPRLPRLNLPHTSREAGFIDRSPGDVIERRRVAFTPSEFVPWGEFLAFHFDWAQGEHVTLVGPTGTGKTTLALQILPIRDYVIAIATKQRDPVLYKLASQGYMQVEELETPAEIHPRIVLAAPLPRGADSISDQREIVKDALLSVYRQGGWCVYLDELRYITEYLKLGRDVELLWQQGRSAGISVVGGAQRPAFIPLAAYDSATHLFFWRDNDKRNLDRIGGIGSHDSQAIAREVSNLEPHVVLYVNSRTGEKLRTKVTPG